MQKFQRYTQNLRHDNQFIYSYNTKVAKINTIDQTLCRLGYWSRTTSKHINYAARMLCLKVIEMEG